MISLVGDETNILYSNCNRYISGVKISGANCGMSMVAIFDLPVILKMFVGVCVGLQIQASVMVSDGKIRGEKMYVL